MNDEEIIIRPFGELIQELMNTGRCPSASPTHRPWYLVHGIVQCPAQRQIDLHCQDSIHRFEKIYKACMTYGEKCGEHCPAKNVAIKRILVAEK